MYYHSVGDATTDLLIELDALDGTQEILCLDTYDVTGGVPVATGRAPLKPGMPGTSWASFGDICVAVNGIDAPLKIWPRYSTAFLRTEPFGIMRRPGAPIPLFPARGDMGTVAASTLTYAASLGTTDVTVAYPADTTVKGSNLIGLGDPVFDHPSTYRYAYTWVTDTGSESPLSDVSAAVNWLNGISDQAYRYGIVLTNIEPGPPGTVKRRVFRSRNIKQGQTEDPDLFFLTEIPNNFETAFGDHIPDSNLGTLAPTNDDAYPLPPQCRLIAAHMGRCWLVSQDYLILWSHVNQPEQFGLADYVDVGSRAGGRITGLVPYNDMLVVLRENAIDAVVTDVNGVIRAVPLTSQLGSRAPHGALVTSDWGLLLAANDGIYQMQGNLRGGGQVHFQKLSTHIEPIWSRVNTIGMAACWAFYNPTDREVSWSIPDQGQPTPLTHLVLHLDLGERPPSFSLRKNTEQSVGVTNPEGTVTLGNSGTGKTSAELYSVNLWGAYPPRDIGTWESTDLTLDGDPDKVKVVRSVTLSMDTDGATAITLSAYPDYGWVAADTAASGTYVYDRTRFSIYGTAVQGTDTYGKTGITQVRFDLNNMWCRYFRFKIQSASIFGIHGYTVHYDIKGPDLPYSPVVASGSVPASRKP